MRDRTNRRRGDRPEPTSAELEILDVLWEHGASSVADVVAKLPHRPGYTTVLKLLQIMLSKELVSRDESERKHRYEAAVSRDDTRTRLVGDLLDRAFGGSSSRLVLHALSSRPASAHELDEIEETIAQLRQAGRKSRDAGNSRDRRRRR